MLSQFAKPSRGVLTLAYGLSLLTTALLYAGPLNPPPGPVTSTYKTLTEVEPRIAINATNTPGDADSSFKITLPGSYYLTGNISGEAGKHAIEIASDLVTLDLGGFAMEGNNDANYDGVFVPGPYSYITVRNGSLRNWGRDGINMATSGAFSCRVENVLANGFRYGIHAGLNTIIKGCSTFGCATGIYAKSGSTLSDCAASRASNVGIYAENGCSLTNCSAYDNNGTGIFAIGSAVTGCSAVANGNAGLGASTGSAFTNCTASNNSSHGFTNNANCSFTNCTATANGGSGFNAGTSNSFTNCSANINVSHGFNANSGSTITGCSSFNNTGNGFIVATGSTVVDSNARSNVLDGIRCSSDCIIRGNTCSGNGFGLGDGAGIHATAGNNRIEENNCSAGDRGIDVDVSGNVIIRNTCRANTISNWDIAANNVYGPILDRTAPTSAAVNGNSAPDAIGTAHPNANITY